MSQLQIDQLNQKLNAFDSIRQVKVSEKGWVHTVRKTLGMTLEQLGKKLSLSRQNVRALELREAEGSITIKSLREAARALDMELVYGFAPIDGSLHDYIDKKANQLATSIVLRTAQSMKLENQANTDLRIQEAIQERKATFIREMPKALWD